MEVSKQIRINDFIKRWSGYHKEEEDARSFLIELLQEVLDVDYPTKHINFEKKVRVKGNVKKIDAYIPETRTLIEMKSSDVDLNNTHRKDYETAFDQAKLYYDNLRMSERGRYILTSNFHGFEIYDMENPGQEPVILQLENLEKEYKQLEILINPDLTNPEAEKIRAEQELSVRAGELVGELYNLLLKQFGDHIDDQQLKEINILIVRIVFCLYAEDSGLFNDEQFHNFLKSYSYQNVNRGLEDLFVVLDTPDDKRIPAYLTPELMAFPYVNGGLFAKRIRIPRFTPEITKNILESMSEQFDWSGISPTIFGAVFESTLNPETRRSGGMHYTSVENIHKVIDPLFLDDLKSELEEIKSLKRDWERNRRLEEFQSKLSKLKFLDPACGSGNFLTESYLSLRKLENEAIAMQTNSGEIRIDMAVIQVHIQQFYGIEINDFAVSVATTALYIAESQMFEETQNLVYSTMQFLPLRSYSNVREGDALLTDWNDVVPNTEVSYIIGNPPFYGARYMTKKQKAVLLDIFKNYKRAGNLDYVTGWFKKAADYMKGTSIRAAFVSTNSITQGEQPALLFKPLFENGIIINFAWLSFIWNNTAATQAHVHCVIIGFSYQKSDRYYLYDKDKTQVQHINGYLIDGEDIFIESRTTPLCNVPKIGIGNQPIDNGNYLFTEAEKNEFINKEPRSARYFHKWYGSYEFINNNPRYCLWLGGCTPDELKKMPEAIKRIKNVREYRLASKRTATIKMADNPTHFQVENMPEGSYILIPKVSSQRREYVPMGFMEPSAITSDAASIIPNASIYHYGILTSSVHMGWMRTVAGRLKGDYRYTSAVVYNTFPWPEPTPQQRSKIEQTAQAILDTREKYSGSLADLYDPVTMPLDLRKAHEANDKAVMAAYGMPKKITEPEIVAWLMRMYKQLTDK